MHCCITELSEDTCHFRIYTGNHFLWFSHKIDWLILKHWDVHITPSTKTKPVFPITLTRMASIFQGPRGSLVKNKMAQNNCFVYSLLDDYCTKLVSSHFCPIDLSTYIFINSTAALLLVLSILADFLKSLIIFWYCVACRQKLLVIILKGVFVKIMISRALND